jgi:NADPH2:quinone reductase
MRAVLLESLGEPETLTIGDVPAPAPAEGQELVHVRAAGVNFLEVLVRRGAYPQAPELPWIPGLEIAGETEGGRRVLGLVRATGGGYADAVAVDGEWLFDLPADASFAEGAALLMAFLTAWLPLPRQAPVRHGRRLLVTAAAGAVGSAAVQVGCALGAEVVVATGSEEKLSLPLSLGAVHGTTYDTLEDVGQVDVVLDPVGGSVLTRSLPLLRPLGAAVAIGYAGGPWEPVDPRQLVGRNVGVHGLYLGRLMQLQPQLVREAAHDLLRMWAQGIVRPVVGATYPFERAADAHRLIEERRSTGKVVLVS